MFICIDGIDGCGKSTQARLLVDWLGSTGKPVVAVRDPGGTKLSESLREILLQRVEIPLGNIAEMLLFMASRAQLVEEVIVPAIDAGHHVVADRFLLSTVAYQGVAGGIAPERIWEVGQIATRGISPDMTFLLDLPAEMALARLGAKLDRLESRGLEYMQAVRDGFLTQAKQWNGRIVTLNATSSMQAIHQQIVEHVREA